MEVSGQPHDPVTLSLGKEPPVLLDRRLVRSQSRYVHCGEKRNLAPVGFRTHAIQSVARRYTD
jgi:hypothetical protein